MADNTHTGESYADFVDKFKPKKTSDDCYTPPLVVSTVVDYVIRRYGVKPASIVRPFYPGGDYTREYYPPGCCVVDNPPFSIETEIVNFYNARGIKFFLYCPYLTCIGIRGCTKIICAADVVYANGADVKTCFLTNMEPGIIARSDPYLCRAVTAASDEYQQASKKKQPKYEYPDNIISATMLGYLAVHGVELTIKETDAAFVRTLDAMKAAKKSGIFGSGLLLSTEAAARKKAAYIQAEQNKAAEAMQQAAAAKMRADVNSAGAYVWSLSQRELEIIKGLDNAGR